MAAGGGSRWRVVVVVVGMGGLALVVAAMGLALRGSDLPTAANVAQLVSVILAVPPLAFGLLMWWRPSSSRRSTPEQVAQAYEQLRVLVSRQWQEEIQIRGLDEPRLPVRWRLSEVDGGDRADVSRVLRAWLRPAGVRFSGRTDRMDKMARRFRKLARRRLVILGEAGAGKTTLAVLLLRQLLRDAPREDPLPVLLSMAGWDPDAEPVHRWLTRRLRENYPALDAAEFGPNASAALVSQQRILPILDGLDELPEQVRPKVLSALNAAATTESVILTCRTEDYRAAAAMPGAHVLAGGAVIHPLPIRPDDAVAYLGGRLAPDQDGAWPELLTAVTDEPHGPLAVALSSPLALWLLRKVYIDTRGDPAPLCDRARFPTADAVTEHLLDNLVTAAFSAARREYDPDDPYDHDHPFRPRGVWSPRDAGRWLAFLAHHMSRTGTHDLRWWQLYRAVPRRWSAILGAVTVGLTVGLTVGITSGLTLALTRVIEGGPAGALLFGLVGGLTGGLAGGLTGGILLEVAKRSVMEPAYADVRLKRRLGPLCRHLAFGLAVGVSVGVVVTLALQFVGGLGGSAGQGLRSGLVVGAAGGLTIGLSRWVGTVVTNARPQTPDITLRRDLELVYVRSLAFGLALGPAFGLAGAVTQGYTGLLSAVQIGVVFGVAGGLVFTVTFDLTGASSTYLAALSLLYARRRVPRRLMRFLDDAHRVGLLREVGAVYQFRHAKLQDRLAQAHQGDPGDSR